MVVYVVVSEKDRYEEQNIEGVFSTEQGAKDYVEVLRTLHPDYDTLDYERFVLDPLRRET